MLSCVVNYSKEESKRDRGRDRVGGKGGREGLRMEGKMGEEGNQWLPTKMSLSESVGCS